MWSRGKRSCYNDFPTNCLHLKNRKHLNLIRRRLETQQHKNCLGFNYKSPRGPSGGVLALSGAPKGCKVVWQRIVGSQTSLQTPSGAYLRYFREVTSLRNKPEKNTHARSERYSQWFRRLCTEKAVSLDDACAPSLDSFSSPNSACTMGFWRFQGLVSLFRPHQFLDTQHQQKTSSF